RGCPYSRAALELLREREVDFNEVDMTDDQGLQSHVARLTGRKTSPQILVHDQAIGGFDELRELVLDGDLQRMIDTPPAPADGTAPADEADEADEIIDAAFLDDPIEISSQEVRDRLGEGSPLLLLDVRREDEWESTGVLPGALMIPVGELEARADELTHSGVWITYCRSGKRSLKARDILTAHGFKSVLSMRGGILEWLDNGGPTVPPAEAAAARPKVEVAKRLKLPVVNHPERSPFEELELGDADASSERLEGKALVERVLEVLDEVRPMVQSDGGDIELLDVQDDVVAVKLTGNCIGCPSSQATLKQGIERRLMQRIPQLKGISSPQLQP
ncbi:MAG: NifU family protein, partial [Myxococcales bacterium]|nr:NifU family protein [Myxococcales bacterium]